MYDIIYFSFSPVAVGFRAAAIINGIFTLFHLKHAKVPSRLLLSMAFLFLGLASWFSAIAVSLPVDQVYAVPLMIFFSTVCILLNIVIFSASMIHLFKKELSNLDLLFIILPIVGVIITLFYSPYDFQYYDYGWGISDYKLSTYTMSPFAIITMVYVAYLVINKIKTMENRKLARKMRILLFGWIFAFISWGIIMFAKILTGFPDIAAIVISAVLWFTQYPFLTEKAKP